MITIRMEEFSAGIMPRQSYTRPCVILYVVKVKKRCQFPVRSLM